MLALPDTVAPRRAWAYQLLGQYGRRGDYAARAAQGKTTRSPSALSYERTEREAERAAFGSRRTNVVSSPELDSGTRMPELCDAAATFVKAEDLAPALASR